MSDPKLAKAAHRLLREVQRIAKRFTKATVLWLLRVAFITNRRGRYANAGFVLPTTAMLVLVVTLTAGALSYRAFNTSNRAIGDLQNRVIYNSATPAIDRARAKLEFMFDPAKDFRFPGGVPSEKFLTSMMLNDGSNINGAVAAPLTVGGADPYQLPDEQRLDINGDNQKDNAWAYREDTDRDGKADATIVYSILFSTPNDTGLGTNQVPGYQKLLQLDDDAKVRGETQGNRVISFARTGPLSNAKAKTCGSGSTGGGVEQGWYEDQGGITSTLRKNFQVDAFVIPDKVAAGAQGNFTTLEFQQDRQLDRGNKWGAWFRNDMEIFPGPPFNWNGAIHTEGSFIASGSFTAYLVSTRPSCVYSPARSSEISVTEKIGSTASDTFYGLFSSGTIRDNNTNSGARIHIYSDNPQDIVNNTGNRYDIPLTASNDWFNGSQPINIALNPARIQENDGYQARGGDTSNAGNRDMSNMGANNKFPLRFFANQEIAPYVDDTYRADDRYGPKQRYKGSVVIPSGARSGDVIPNSDPNYDQLVATSPLGNDDTNVGLDGYWERRALNEGARIIVGQRLELGNSSGWSAPKDRPNTLQDGVLQPLDATTLRAGDGNVSTVREFDGAVLTGSALENTDPELNDDSGDPLYAPASLSSANPHENRQRRALRDNSAAVQATAVYHHASDSGQNYPIACLASTAHHGSPYALARSINFLPTIFKNTNSQDVGLIVDFFNGKGTNGWEFEPPQQNETNFASAVANTTSPLRIALDNLANFAGDPQGAFPAEQVSGEIHPDPEVTMWGDFSNLRRTLQRLDAVGYNALSPADKTNLETASCTLGMLAYNIEQVRQFDPKNPANDQGVAGIGQTGRLMGALGFDLFELMDGVNDPVNGNLEVVPRQQLSTYQYGKINGLGGDPGNINPSYYNARDYDRVPAEAFLAKLRESYERNGLTTQERRKLAMAELVFAHFQIERDRTYGFRASPAANTWNYNPYVYFNDALGGFQLFSSACDPNTFAFTSTTAGANETGKASAEKVKLQLGAEQNVIRFRIGLSRLCGTVIPNGALREGPGDLHIPVRNDNTNLARFLVTQNGSSPFNLQGVTLALPEGVNAPNPTSFSAPERKEGLAYFWEYQKYFDNRKVTGAGLDSPEYRKEYYLRASVAPKWPSLYYLFPQVQHGLTGGLTSFAGIGGGTVCIDHRQPTGSLTYFDPDNCNTSGTPLRAAFQPWAEPYVTDPGVAASVGTYLFKPVDNGGAGNPSNVSPLVYTVGDDNDDGQIDVGTTKCDFSPNGKHCYRSFNFPLTGRSVAGLVVRPRRLPAGFNNPTVLDATAGTWQTPIFALDSITTRQQFRPTNRIIVPNGNNFNSARGVTAVIPFLDRVMFNGREWLPARVMDIDLGMLRHEIVTPGEPWLPMSGIIYAFREDSVREDAIARSPNGATGAQTNATSTDPAAQSDPAYSSQKISFKAVDYVPEPERRVHGFRLRDGAILRRSPNTVSGASTGIEEQDNIRGLSFFSDDPVYIMGYYNLHQTGTSDSAVEDTAINTNNGGGTNRIEEFRELLPTNTTYNKTQFYRDRTNLNPDFANQTKDWWRPSEILADSITILSESFCDGSAIDTFMTTAQSNNAEVTNTTFSGTNKTLSGDDLANYLFPYSLKPGSTVQGAAVYNDTSTGLYGSGCAASGANSRTSFLNQNRPRYNGMFSQNGWAWMRETPDDSFAPVAISRNGSGRVLPYQPAPGNSAFNNRQSKINMVNVVANSLEEKDIARTSISWRKPEPIFDYDFIASRNSISADNTYFRINGSDENIGRRAIPPAQNTRVNSIVISGIGPSRTGSAYGGLHNFPRFLENWNYLWFSGSFLQLSFSNYGTAPFDNDAWEISQSPSTSTERISYYSPPNRLWGYDVALQLAPAGPAAARFVTSSNVRNEFYNEPPANDAYIKALCESLRANNGPLNALDFSGDANAQAAKNRIQNGQFSCPK